MSLTVALMTDVHHGSDDEYVRGTVALPLLREVLAEITQRRPALLVDLGDRVNDSEPDRARAALTGVAACFRTLDVRRCHLLGNQDITPRAEQETVLGVPLGNRSLALGGWQLVFLDTFDGSVEGVLSPQTLGWLERTLASSDRPAAIFSHQPLDGQPLPGNPFFGGDCHCQAHPRGHEAARRLMERSGKVKLAVSGHAHWNHEVAVGGIRYLTLDALVPPMRVGEAGVYGVLTLAEKSIQLEVFGRSPWRVRLGTEQGTALS